MVQNHDRALMDFIHTGEAVIVFRVGCRGQVGKFACFNACGIQPKPAHTVFYFIILITDKKIGFTFIILMIDISKKTLRVFI